MFGGSALLLSLAASGNPQPRLPNESVTVGGRGRFGAGAEKEDADADADADAANLG